VGEVLAFPGAADAGLTPRGGLFARPDPLDDVEDAPARPVWAFSVNVPGDEVAVLHRGEVYRLASPAALRAEILADELDALRPQAEAAVAQVWAERRAARIARMIWLAKARRILMARARDRAVATALRLVRVLILTPALAGFAAAVAVYGSPAL
jgi:hypothetical protein